MRTCSYCKTQKAESLFYVDRTRRDGYQASCKDCQNAQRKIHYQKTLKISREKRRVHGIINRSKLNEYERQFYGSNPGRSALKSSRYKAQKLRAMPQWLTDGQLSEIQDIYARCPKGFHVDHIVPLRGKDVCGLHVPWNLQHLPAVENIKKGNKYV